MNPQKTKICPSCKAFFNPKCSNKHHLGQKSMILDWHRKNGEPTDDDTIMVDICGKGSTIKEFFSFYDKHFSY